MAKSGRYLWLAKRCLVNCLRRLGVSYMSFSRIVPFGRRTASEKGYEEELEAEDMKAKPEKFGDEFARDLGIKLPPKNSNSIEALFGIFSELVPPNKQINSVEIVRSLRR
jgi:hypothetical protein